MTSLQFANSHDSALLISGADDGSTLKLEWGIFLIDNLDIVIVGAQHTDIYVLMRKID